MSPLLAITAIAAFVVILAAPRRREAAIALVPAGVLLVNMALVGAGKPGEFARFALFADIVLAAIVAAAAVHLWPMARSVVAGVLALCLVGLIVDATRYEWSFMRDGSNRDTRGLAAMWLSEYLADTDGSLSVGVLDDPAPYLTPPLPFTDYDLIVLPRERPATMPATLPPLLIHTGDFAGPPAGAWWQSFYRRIKYFPDRTERFWNRPTVISWANKPISIYEFALPPTRRAGAAMIPR